jgi:hypothetical protein
MAYQYRIEPARRLATLTFSGPLDGAEIATATETIYADPAWAFGFDVVWDFRQIRGLHLDVGHFPALLALDRRFADVAGPGADLLVTGRDAHHMLARLFAHLSRGGPRHIVACRTGEEAAAALERVRAERLRPGPTRAKRAP